MWTSACLRSVLSWATSDKGRLASQHAPPTETAAIKTQCPVRTIFFWITANEILFSSCVFQKRNCFLLIYVKCPVAHHVMFTPVTCMFMCCHGDRVHNDVCAVHEVTAGQCSHQG